MRIREPSCRTSCCIIWEHERKTVLFITHAVDEAVFLSDRVLVMGAAPGAIRADIAIDLPRPRRRENLLRDRATRSW